MTYSHITWRGSLRSCNYTCTYCPFAKKQASLKSLSHDKASFNAFIKKMSTLEFSGSILLAPYGEGLIHPYYQEYYGSLSRISGVSMVSCQTNLSWDAPAFLTSLKKQKADFSRLALWATFHPGMMDVDLFIKKCQELSSAIRLCVGMVGNPDDIAVIKKVKQMLPAHIGFWINKMDGLKRPYTTEEVQIFSDLDTFFPLELKRFPANACCHGCFIDSKEECYLCNRAKTKFEWNSLLLRHTCKCQGICDCFLAYSNRKDIPQLLHLGPYPQLRLPWTPPKILFFDLDGTIAEKGIITADNHKRLQLLSQRYKIYLMTGRNEDNAKKVFHYLSYLSGGVFSYGAEVKDYCTSRQQIIPLPKLSGDARRTYCSEKLPIKQIFTHRPAQLPPGCRLIRDGVFSAVAVQANKLDGVKLLCQWNGWKQEEVFVYGNGFEDIAVLESFPYSAAPMDSPERVLDKARYHINFKNLTEMLMQ